MNTKNLSLIFLLVFGVIIIFGAGIYAGFVVKDSDMPWLVKLHLTKPENSDQTPVNQKTALATDRKAVLSFLPLSGNQKIGQDFCVKIILDSQDQRAYGVDVLVNYDSGVLELMPEIMSLDAVYSSSTLARLASGNMITKEWGNGKVVFSKLADAQQSWQNEKELVDLCFKPLQKTTADLKFFFDKDSTSDCNVAGENGQDILGQVYDAHFNITN